MQQKEYSETKREPLEMKSMIEINESVDWNTKLKRSWRKARNQKIKKIKKRAME